MSYLCRAFSAKQNIERGMRLGVIGHGKVANGRKEGMGLLMGHRQVCDGEMLVNLERMS